ncbi:MAG: mandelate racemase/muconate lactonizing enzyme family protein [Solirubrobacterales bacterium]
MRIAEATVDYLQIPLPAPVRHPVRTITYRPHLLVRLRSEDGVWGTGFCLQDLSAAPAMAAATELLLPLVVGADAAQVRAISEDMYRQSVRNGRRGNVLHALSAIDIALWDLRARSLGLPLRHLLGGYRDSVPAYASGGYYYESDGERRLREEFEGYLATGFRHVKMKTGRLSVPEEAARVRTVRETIGPDVKLMIDANQAFTRVDECVAFCKRVEEFDITFFEEPFSADQPQSFLRLRERTSIPLATGEVESTRWAFGELIRHGVVDYVQPDVTACGGITEFLEIAALAGEASVGVAPHYHWDIHLQLACARPEVYVLEKFEGTAVKSFDLVLAEPFAVNADGELVAPDGPGHGIDFDEEAVVRYRVDTATVGEVSS